MDNAILEDKSATRKPAGKSGILSLFALPGDGSGPSEPYGRFKVTRGFIDDLNRTLPIRLRIQLEGEISGGGLTGAFQAGQVHYRWEFQPQ